MAMTKRVTRLNQSNPGPECPEDIDMYDDICPTHSCPDLFGLNFKASRTKPVLICIDVFNVALEESK